jgi:3-hydroxyisobutyrate dehydrogenase-like beta-hydroxyacid dehydrogenase
VKGLFERVGVLYTGEMGAALSRRLVHEGFSVLSCVSGRSMKTRINAENNGVTLRDSIDEVVAESELVFSLVPPQHALDIAESISGAMRRTGNNPIYVDGNSVGPSTMREIESAIKGSGSDVLDGVFIGSASMLDSKTVLYLSGERAEEVARVLEKALRVFPLGKEAGEACALKMCFAGFNKGLVALFLEVVSAAERIGRRDLLLRSLEDFYPGTVETVRRLLPSYPTHCGRRLQEMEELVSFLRELGQAPAMSVGICSVFESFREIFMEQIDQDKRKGGRWTLEGVLDVCSAKGLLRDNRPTLEKGSN